MSVAISSVLSPADTAWTRHPRPRQVQGNARVGGRIGWRRGGARGGQRRCEEDCDHSAVAKRAGRRRIVLGPGQHWTLRLPSELATPRAHRRTLCGLALRVISPAWTREAMVAGRPTAFDPPGFERLVNERRLRRTRSWGWPAREMASADLTGYERIRRGLMLAWALARLRGHIITEVNAVVAVLSWARRSACARTGDLLDLHLRRRLRRC